MSSRLLVQDQQTEGQLAVRKLNSPPALPPLPLLPDLSRTTQHWAVNSHTLHTLLKSPSTASATSCCSLFHTFMLFSTFVCSRSLHCCPYTDDKATLNLDPLRPPLFFPFPKRVETIHRISGRLILVNLSLVIVQMINLQPGVQLENKKVGLNLNQFRVTVESLQSLNQETKGK